MYRVIDLGFGIGFLLFALVTVRQGLRGRAGPRDRHEQVWRYVLMAVASALCGLVNLALACGGP